MTEKYTFTFEGFSKNSILFLKDIEKNNNKVWFEKHKSDYQNYLLKPLQSLSNDLGPFMLRIDPYLEINKTVSRIYRDARFSKDKSPYKSCMWITFKRVRDNWQEKPAFFFEVKPNSYRFGMGFCSASKQTIDKFREAVVNDPDSFLREIAFFKKQQKFVLEGEKYKKSLSDSLPDKILEWYNRKNFYLVCNRKIDDVLYSKDLLKDIVTGFDKVGHFYNYLWEVLK